MQFLSVLYIFLFLILRRRTTLDFLTKLFLNNNKSSSSNGRLFRKLESICFWAKKKIIKVSVYFGKISSYGTRTKIETRKFIWILLPAIRTLSIEVNAKCKYLADLLLFRRECAQQKTADDYEIKILPKLNFPLLSLSVIN